MYILHMDISIQMLEKVLRYYSVIAPSLYKNVGKVWMSYIIMCLTLVNSVDNICGVSLRSTHVAFESALACKVVLMFIVVLLPDADVCNYLGRIFAVRKYAAVFQLPMPDTFFLNLQSLTRDSKTNTVFQV